MWVARDKDRSLFMFNNKPIKSDKDTWRPSKESEAFKHEVFTYERENGFCCSRKVSNRQDYVELDETLYPEITFKNSPKELIIK